MSDVKKKRALYCSEKGEDGENEDDKTEIENFNNYDRGRKREKEKLIKKSKWSHYESSEYDVLKEVVPLVEQIPGDVFVNDEFFPKYQKTDNSDSEGFGDDETVEEVIKSKEKKANTIFELFEPYDLAEEHYSNEDHAIKNTDIPERMQKRRVPVSPVRQDSDELDREAEWIYKHGFTKPMLAKKVNYQREDCDEWLGKTDTENKIKKVGQFYNFMLL